MVGSWGHVLSREQDVCHCLSMPYLDLDIPEQRDAQKQEAENKVNRKSSYKQRTQH